MTDEQTGISTATTYDQAYPFQGQVLSSEQRLADGTRINRQQNTLAVLNPTPHTNFTYVAESRSTRYEFDGSIMADTTTRSTYDLYGNPTEIRVDYSGGFVETTTNTYTNDEQNWFLGRLTRAQVTSQAPGQVTQIRTSAYAYDEAGLLLAEATEPDIKELKLVKTYERDGYGNIILSNEHGSQTDRTYTTDYDTKGRYVVRSTNALGHTETREYDPRFGVLLRLVGPNGLGTTWDYDDFGRQRLETRADGSQSTQAYLRCDSGYCPAGAVYSVRSQTSGSPAAYAYFDILDRPIRQESVGFAGQAIYVDTQYDERGYVKQVSEPYFAGEPQHWTRYTYDATGRPLTQTLPDGSQVSTVYQGLTTVVTNAKNQTETRTLNRRGWLISSTDNHGESISYGYDSAGNLIEMVDPAGNVTAMQYDLRGRKVAMSDPDAGLTRYLP